MLGDTTLLHNYSPQKGNSSVRITDNSLSMVLEIESVNLTKDISLTVFLYIQHLDCNLFLVRKLSQDLNYIVKIFPHLCAFQEIKSRKIIGSAKLVSELYLL